MPQSGRTKAIATFQPVPGTDLTTLWVYFAAKDAGAEITLFYDYPDLKPVAGWQVVVGDTTYRVASVAGLVLTCTGVSV